MAGYVSDARKWTKFETRWNQILRRENVACFHMTDFASKRKEYEGWKPERRARFLNDLVECAWKYTNKAFSATVVLEDYHAADKKYCLHETLGQPYSVCGRSWVGHVKKWARKHGIKQVVFVFESGDQDWGDLQRICREEEKIDPGFYSKKDFVPFQAADLIAWKSRHPIRQSLHINDDVDFTIEEGQRLLEAIRVSVTHDLSAGIST